MTMPTSQTTLAISLPDGLDGGDPAPALAERYLAVRRWTEQLTEGLAAEDMVVQSMPDVSPTKWHLAHTSWFFEQFVLLPHLRGYEPLNETYLYLFNSYYHQVGERHCRDQRGYISRPTVAEVMDYRRHVDAAMVRLLGPGDDEGLAAVEQLVTLGLNHEQQHQELLLTDIKHVFSVNPLRPVYGDGDPREGAGTAPALAWVAFEEGLHEIGDDGRGFAYDNEAPRHRRFLESFELANRPVTNGEYLDFMDDGGYARPELWLSLGWAAVQDNGWTEPFYWERRDGRWTIFTLGGTREVDPAEPVCHLNYFEADAFARWAGARLPTEAAWEVGASSLPIDGNQLEARRQQPWLLEK
jgi:ergothioneine biosynthesis protein EgtB